MWGSKFEIAKCTTYDLGSEEKVSLLKLCFPTFLFCFIAPLTKENLPNTNTEKSCPSGYK
jgi:hypothetical protein